MTKVVYNACFGGFGLSKEAMQKYAEIKGWEYRPDDEDRSWSTGKVVSLEGVEYSEYDLDDNRTDPVLVQVVEELGRKADGMCARLVIADLPAGTRYRIDEYDGSEYIETEDDVSWSVA